MNFAIQTGNTRVIEVCKSYMGDDDTVVIDRVNKELAELGDKPPKFYSTKHWTNSYLTGILNVSFEISSTPLLGTLSVMK